MSFLNPSYLWALFGLVIPIAIHLWSKKEGKVIKVGSIKLLSEVDSKQSSSIQLNEILLLALRCSLIIAVVFSLAEPQIKKKVKNSALTYLIEPSLLNDNRFNVVIDTLKDKAPVKILSDGFPEIDNFDTKNMHFKTPNYWYLAKTMEQLKTDSIVVFTNAYSNGLQGKRPIVSSSIEWLIIDSNTYSDALVSASIKTDSIEITSALSNSENLKFQRQKVPQNSALLNYNSTKDSISRSSEKPKKWLQLVKESSITISIVYDDSLKNDMNYLNASFRAISKHLNRTIEINNIPSSSEEINTESTDLLVWLSQKPMVQNALKTLVFLPDPFAQHLIEPGSTKHNFYLTAHLNADNSVSKHLPEQLLRLLNINAVDSSVIEQANTTTVSRAELLPNYINKNAKTSYSGVFNSSKWMWLLVFLLSIVERFAAKYRKQ